MASYAAAIAEAVTSVLAGLTPEACPIEWRRTDVIESRETVPRVIITNGPEMQVNRGALGDITTPLLLGSVFKGYTVGITVYDSNDGELAGNDVNPSFILRAKQTLNTASLTGVPEVWDTDLVENNLEWENQPFRDGAQVSRFAVLFITSEPRNG